MKALVFTPFSIIQMAKFSVSNEWFSEYWLPDEAAGLKRVVIDDVVYIIETNLDDDNGPLVAINLESEYSVFSEGRENVPVLERITTVARSIFTKSVKIPPTWRSYIEHSILSIYASSKQRGRGSRINFNLRPNGKNDLFAFACTDDTVNFSLLPTMEELHQQIRDNLADAILAPLPETVESSRAGIVLAERIPQGFVQGATLEQWYEAKLTSDQRQFVDKMYDGPVRLRGVAGTGKTLCLVIKLLLDGGKYESEKKDVRLCFISHSLASVDLVTSMAESLDPLGLLLGHGKHCTIEVRTLYDLAQEHLRFELDKLQPLSLDGRDGRTLQAELIGSVLLEMRNSVILKARFSDISPDVNKRWIGVQSSDDSDLIPDLMNEFANVLEAENIRMGEERGEKYAKGTSKRHAWLMRLETETDRRFVLEVHRRYRELLRDMNTLSVDQMVADFSTFLDSNRWNQIRDRSGYDALFVDELHLFNAIERQTLHRLIKRAVDDKGLPKRPPVFMAYDLKQSPRDSFTQYYEPANNLFSSTNGLQNSELVKLDKVFRYTPQIAEFLTDLDAAFPAIDIPGEWEAYSGTTKLDDGPNPEIHVFKDDKSLFESVFDAAVLCARSAIGGGRRVAVLCPSEEIFDRYLPIANGRYKGKMLPIIDREPSPELRYAGKRFIFSMPEYVAGLQFETVFLIHVDANEAPTNTNIGVRRRFISSVYLGSSRAEKTLKISSSLSRGGFSDIFQMALERKSLLQV